MSQRASGHPRIPNEFYIEPPECTMSLIDACGWVHQGFHDPFCGSGTIVDVATRLGIAATGADLVDRCSGRFPVRNFFTDANVYPNLVCNPPFTKAHTAIEYALNHLPDGGRIALFLDVNFLGCQERYPLHTRPEFEGLLVLSQRPSVPPGDKFLAGEIKRGNGSTVYGWFIYQRGRTGTAAGLAFAPPMSKRRQR
jgi:hypothetical protein